MWTREELKGRGKVAFWDNYWPCVVAALVLMLISGSSAGSVGRSSQSAGNSLVDPFYTMGAGEILALIIVVLFVVIFALLIGSLIKIFLFNPLKVSCYRFFVINDGTKASLSELGYCFNANYKNIVKVMFLRDLYVFMWTLLLIVPGVIKSYEYLLVPYLLAEDSSISSQDIFIMSRGMMEGNKMDTFVLKLSFIGWYLLSIVTFGLLSVFYVSPYEQCTIAALYNRLKEQIIPIGMGSY